MGCFSGVFSGFRHFNLQALPIDRLNETMAAMTVKAERSPAAVTLPPDTLTSTFGYLDLVDIPWAARVAKDWSRALRSTGENEVCRGSDGGDDSKKQAGLWLSLIRKHYPTVERITRMLPEDCGEEAASIVKEPPTKKHCGDGSGDVTANGNAGQTKIPAPSKNWRRQFQRAHMLAHRLVEPKEERVEFNSNPKPLSSYSFQLDLVLYQGELVIGDYGHYSWPSGRTQIGVVSRIYDEVSFSGACINLSYKDGGDLLKYDFTSFDIRISIIEKSTGKRSKLYEGSYSDAGNFNLFCFCHDLVETISSPILDASRDTPCICSNACITRTGCISLVDRDKWDGYFGNPGPFHSGESWGVFDPPSLLSVDKCSCDAKWKCFWDMDIGFDLEFIGAQGHPYECLSVTEQLLILEKAHVLPLCSDTEQAEEKPKKELKPLSAYFFQVDLILYQQTKGRGERGRRVGVVSRISDDMRFSNNLDAAQHEFQFKDDGKMLACEFSYFDIRITVFERSTGRQTKLLESRITDELDENKFGTDIECIVELTSCVIDCSRFNSSCDISTFLTVSRTGCIATLDDDDWDIFDPPALHATSICRCGTLWECFWNMEIALEVGYWDGGNYTPLSTIEQLRFLGSLDFV